ncbi:UDP-glycosyltransferase 89C1-like [Gossypium australe]|uniref:UDP-glycosyltransferase 89C1-like n=1 Tax=Gossypium australe TaxID=47621 RepID=A0A5B6W8V7_9ROSI|nr:UDP-glycosyltransferase 89C1-like [Gossypium australe]
MEELKDVMEDLALVDVKTDKRWYTWINNPTVARQNTSDRDAILLDTLGRKPSERVRDSRLTFKYDMCWANEKEAKDVITFELCRKKIDKIIDGPQRTNSAENLRDNCIKLGQLYAKEESDRNTSFFHVRATSRLRRNRVDRLKNSNGIWVSDTNEICKVAWDYFIGCSSQKLLMVVRLT